MDSDKIKDVGEIHVESNDGNIAPPKELSEKFSYRTVEVDYENLMKLVEYADEMAKHILHFCTVVPDNENEESLMLLYSYQNFRGSADADHGERKAPTMQEMSKSEPRKQDNPEMSTNT